MSAPAYNVKEGSLQDKFDKLRTKVQVYGGGFGNGKTAAAMVLKALRVAKDYPGANILIARETYPKLNDTARKEFFKWCPKDWVVRMPTKDDNTCILKNGTTINFRYIAQQSKGGESSTSNLLSATYDLVIVDQIEDPGISHKDFIDLMGRLRGSARYRGDDPTMPSTGPRQFIVTANPTRNWFYKKIVRPLHIYQESGRRTEDLLWDEEADAPMLGLVEGSTYENKDNVPDDFIRGLEASYTGSMRQRFLMGEWSGYEGLVYPAYDTTTHQVNFDEAWQYFQLLPGIYNVVPTVVEGYDYGMVVPSCYLFGLADHLGNVVFLDGFYKPGLMIGEQIQLIKDIRARFCKPPISAEDVLADPAIFRRSAGSKEIIGQTVAALFWDGGNGVRMVRGNNDVINGISKVQQYLAPSPRHRNPFNHVQPAPRLYFADTLDFVDTEISDYYWDRDTSGEPIDKPRGVNDHAMDTLKYAMSKRPKLNDPYVNKQESTRQAIRQWHEPPDTKPRTNSMRSARYG